MLLFFVVHATDLEMQPQSPQATTAIEIQRDQTPLPLLDQLGALQTKQEWFVFLQVISTITDYTCQTAQICLTIPQLTSNLSQETGMWLNSFNLAAGIIALSQIPIKQWLVERLAETDAAIERLRS